MKRIGRNDPCPCGAGEKLKRCCGPAIDGRQPAPTAEALMRSRYVAYVTGAVDYLYSTTHPDNPAVKDRPRADFIRELTHYCRQVTFDGLTIHSTVQPDAQGVASVVFTALMHVGDQHDRLDEHSDFLLVDGRWLYWRALPMATP